MIRSASATLCAIFESYGDKPAIIDEAGTLSYAAIVARTKDISASLNQHNCVKGSIITITLSQLREFIPTLLAILENQCIALPIAPNTPLAILQNSMNAIGSPWLVTSNGANHPQMSRLSLGSNLSLNYTPTVEEPNIHNYFPDAGIIRYTSGTTGEPKGVVLSHTAIIERTEVSSRLLSIGPDDTIISPVTLSYHFIASALSFLRAGAKVIESAGQSAEHIIDLAMRHNASLLYGDPEFYRQCAMASNGAPIPSLAQAISTSTSLSTETARRFEERFSKRITQVYGIIEVGLPLWNSNSAGNPCALGSCQPPYECMIQSLEDENSGELCLAGPGLFSGYIFAHNRIEPAPLIEQKWFPTGDIVAADRHGILTLRGRKKTAITIDEATAYPEEIEYILLQHEGVRNVRVLYDEPACAGQHMLIAEIIPSDLVSVEKHQLQALCKAVVPPPFILNEIRFVETLPHTSSGKIKRTR